MKAFTVYLVNDDLTETPLATVGREHIGQVMVEQAEKLFGDFDGGRGWVMVADRTVMRGHIRETQGTRCIVAR